MAQNLDDIIKELDAAYNPSREAINNRINGLQGAQDADVAGLEAQKNQAFGDITDGARARGMGFSGIPLQEQAKYTASSFLPAVAKVKQSYNEGRNSLADSLNNMNIDQRKTAMSIRETQQNRDFEAEQARLTREASARAAAAASGSSLAGLLAGGDRAGAPTAGTAQLARDPYATVNKNGANSAIKQLLGTNNAGIIARTLNAISSSAARGNAYDKYKLELIQSLAGNSQYGSLIAQAAKLNNSKIPGVKF
jgi:hypothetical protein